MLMSLGAGLGIGLMLGLAMSKSENSQLGWLDRRTAESFGRRVIDSVTSRLPDSIREYVQS